MATPSAPAGRCPVAHDGSDRKTARGADAAAPALEERAGTWHVRSYAAVRQVLRDADATRQAGFNAEMATRTGLSSL